MQDLVFGQVTVVVRIVDSEKPGDVLHEVVEEHVVEAVHDVLGDPTQVSKKMSPRA